MFNEHVSPYVQTGTESEEPWFEIPTPGSHTEPVSSEIGLLVFYINGKIKEVLNVKIGSNNGLDHALEKGSGALQNGYATSVDLILHIDDIISGISQRKFPLLRGNPFNAVIKENLILRIYTDDTEDGENYRIIEIILYLKFLGYKVGGFGLSEGVIENIVKKFSEITYAQAVRALEEIRKMKLSTKISKLHSK